MLHKINNAMKIINLDGFIPFNPFEWHLFSFKYNF